VTRRLLQAVPWVAVVVVALGVSTGSPYLVTVGIVTAIWGILALGLNLLMGYTGLINLGIGAFYALGAYGAAILDLKLHWSPWLLIVVVPAASFLVALLVGPALLRTRGLFFAVATLGLGIIVSDVTGNWIPVTGGPLGLAGINRPGPVSIGGLTLDPSIDSDFFLLMTAALLLCLVAASFYHRSRLARILIAARDDELLATSLGFQAVRYRVLAFAMSGAMAAFAGVLYSWFIRYISPPPFTFFALSFQVFVLVAVGGAGSVWGPLVGAAFLTGIPELIELEPHSKVIAYGIVLLAVIVLMPKGLVPTLSQPMQNLRDRRRRTPVTPAPVAAAPTQEDITV
jgi:branched-chain amino acid transport system permease protein